MDEKLFNREREQPRQKGFKRCGACGVDVMQLYHITLTVGEQTYVKMAEIANSFKQMVTIIKKEPAFKGYTHQIDHVILKPIDGIAYHVNINVCPKCIDIIGRRHKFGKKQIQARKAI